ncbi:aminotransferase class III-fold pyridoxal phosphate-dependent enzyme [Patescibacteria group bacterium]|nr:aminotransferase class III-fold pyridoxal phosphate-dependent enzyme [Patescibacteria group bacterium]
MLPTTREYVDREKKSIFTTTLDDSPAIQKGKGVYFLGLDGRKHIDFTSQVSVLSTGYCPDRVVRALKHTAETVHSGISADWPFCFEFEGMEISRAALAEKLIEISDRVMPFPKKIMFEVSGATAVNAALKIAKISYLRKKLGEEEVARRLEYFNNENIFIPSHHDIFRFSFLHCHCSFHGRHAEAHCLTNSKSVQLWGASSSGAFGRLTFPDASRTEEEIKKEADNLISNLSIHAPVIAFVFEPIQGEGGFRVPDKKNIRTLIGYLGSKGIYIIADEIQAGLGRAGKMFACEHFGIEPDMIILSKSLGAGVPIGAVIANSEKFPDLLSGMHSGSHHCTPLACAAAIVNLKLIEQNLPNAEKMGEYLHKRLDEMKESFSNFVKEVRGKGLMIGVEFYNVDDRNYIIKKAKIIERDLGLLLAPCGKSAIRFCPPIIINEEQIEEGLSIFKKALETLL